MKIPKFSAVFVYLALESCTAFLFSMIFTSSAVYQVTVAQLSALQLVLIGTVLEGSVFLFEIPTGIVADAYSRKLSILIGLSLTGLAFVVEGSFPIFGAILLAQIVWGVGYTFTSGATQAWITDELGSESAAAQVFLRAAQVRNLTALLGIATGSVLGVLRINLPIVLGGILFIFLAIFLLWMMPETNFTPVAKGERNSFQHMLHIFWQGMVILRRRPEFGHILVIGLFYGLYSEGYDRLSTKLILDNFTFPGQWPPVVWFGLLKAVGMLLSVAATEVVRRRLMTQFSLRAPRILFAITAVLVICLLVFAVSPLFSLVAILLVLIGVLRNVAAPIYNGWVNQQLDSSVRATVISMSGQIDSLGQIVGGPVVGIIGNVSVRLAVAFSGMILLPSLMFFRVKNVS